ncbi:hypothetical protein FKX85_00170 [Echinicola soli]|uniref:LiaF transmembrane domain-containing protein n=1 Tax=Echinicola soli TaxID=2591634 RepID=A0A514CCJ8_9BACT|nr:DUF5668 domain-containing protein [Echinicola soli]QDH77539.1 hypothetical protein FKX85_00170 [Echinicola soli]
MKKTFGRGDGGRTTTGLIVLVVGLFLLVKQLGVIVPGWIFSWPMIFVAIGLITLSKHNFQSGFGFFMILFGGFFLLKNELNIPLNIERYLVPAGLILLGLFLLATKNRKVFSDFGNWTGGEQKIHSGGGAGKGASYMSSEESFGGSGAFTSEQSDMVNSQALFCGIQKRILSKNFKGGKVSAIFGGTEIDLTQADLSENAVLSVEVAFGGVKLLMPPHWDLKMGVTNIFAGVEDKRMYPQSTGESNKVLTITGTVLFGGLEIKSY